MQHKTNILTEKINAKCFFVILNAQKRLFVPILTVRDAKKNVFWLS